MPKHTLKIHSPYLTRKRKNHFLIEVLTEEELSAFMKKNDNPVCTSMRQKGFDAKAGQIFIIHDKDGNAHHIYAGTSADKSYKDGSKIHDAIKKELGKDTLDHCSFEFAGKLKEPEFERLQIGWGFASYEFDAYKKPDKDKKHLALILREKSDKHHIKSTIESVFLVRDLVNIPANDMGPDELQSATELVAEKHKLKVKTIKDKDLEKKNFPMIFTVGKGSARRPRLLDFSWGNKKHPKITLVGKGVCFDTGGYDIKPSQYMYNMKKDMGGAAHVLALAHLIISHKLPVNLRVLIPTVENSISGEAYRPADVLQTRKGITVEIGNTDAEGRLVLADALTYACEDKPELIIDYATLTGAARVALGPDLPALFSNTEATAQKIQALSQKNEVNDPMWNLPLWKDYRKEMDSPVADICSTGGKAGATTAALFLNEFIEEGIEWLHIDTYAWEDSGQSGKPKGGADLGLRSIFAFLQDKYK